MILAEFYSAVLLEESLYSREDLRAKAESLMRYSLEREGCSVFNPPSWEFKYHDGFTDQEGIWIEPCWAWNGVMTGLTTDGG